MSETKMTWQDWLEKNAAPHLIELPHELGKLLWQPTDQDRQAAWILYTELRTRISTQTLHYRSGDEETALESIHKLFELTRQVIKENGPECSHFATIAIQVLNTRIRPLTAKWHKKKLEGHLLNDDGRREFRRELEPVRQWLVQYCRVLGCLAEGESFVATASCQSWPNGLNAKDDEAIGPDIPFDHILLEGKVPVRNDLYEAEFKAIKERRHESGPVNNLVGLACSGGGIRSATFCLGVAQALSRYGLLPRVDYLSTVSGGGYFGSFLSSYLNDADTTVGLEADKLPFFESEQAEPQPIRQLRNSSKYLLKGGLLGQARMAGLLVLGLLINLLTLSSVLLLSLALTKTLVLSGVTEKDFQNSLDVVLKGLSVFLLIALLGLPFVHRYWASAKTRIANYEIGAIILALSALGVWLLGWALPWVYHSLKDTGLVPGAVLGLFAALPVLFVGAAFALGSASLVGRVLIGLAGVTGPLMLLMTYFVVNEWSRDWFCSTWVCVVAVPLTIGCLIYWLSSFNANQISPHRYYRNRLAETYLLRRGEKAAVDPQPLSKLRSANPKAPYHLINAAVNLPASKNAELRGRDSDFFLFSQHFCGSPLLGYCRTEVLEKVDPHLDLGTAMAISGAAASSYMGRGTIKGLVFWLALLNIRLGYWLPNPKQLAEGGVPKGLGPPRPLSLWKEWFGSFDEHDSFVNLSDGGHIENLGIYELLRRRCKFIIAIDGEADPELTFPSLMQLIRYAQIDFGIRIRLDLKDLTPNQSGHTKAHFVLGTIEYDDCCRGYLLYIKSSLTGNERDYILDYRRGHPSFPHESTADQFFNEAQFEAYRALGEHIGEDLFQPELLGKVTGKDSNCSLESWFAALKRNLLEEPVR